jgi:Protein of unknown function (DUF3300)
MNPEIVRARIPEHTFRCLTALLCAALLVPGESLAWMPRQEPQAPPPAASKIPDGQLDSLVAPIALYPDPLLAQVLAASTYPLEIIQLQQWMEKHKDLKDKALTDAVMKQNWDPSVQAMAVLPEVVKRLADDIQWTADLGNAFLAQQSDVMDAVQRMRKKAQDKGNLKTTEQQKVETQVVESKSVIVVQPASPEVIYVPSYDPVVVYGPSYYYPYPPIYYPPPGYYAWGMAVSFGVGMMIGAAWGGGWGWGCGWGHNDIDINRNNNFNRNTNIGGNRGGGGNNTWQHNPQHRGAAPYSDRATANKYGGTARGDSMANRQAGARQNLSQRGLQSGTMDRGAGGRGSSNLGGGAGVSNRAGMGGDRVGNRSVPNTAGARNSSAFGGASSRMSGSGARTSSSRGSSSFGGSRGGGFRGGGGRRR